MAAGGVGWGDGEGLGFDGATKGAEGVEGGEDGAGRGAGADVDGWEDAKAVRIGGASGGAGEGG